MKKIKIILLAVIALVIIILISNAARGGLQEVAEGKPALVTLDFYDEWLEAVASTSTDPYMEDLHNTGILSKDLRQKLSDAQEQEGGVDPVLCQSSVPEGLTARPIYTLEDEAQIVILSQDKAVYEQSVVTLKKKGNGWYINDIECNAGEFAPEREFTFEQEGFIVTNVPAPWTAGSWHILFVENETLGIVPLLFNASSVCVVNGEESTCDTSTFTENAEATVYGEMTEYGATVKKLEF